MDSQAVKDSGTGSGETRISGKPEPSQILAAADKMLGRVAAASNSISETAEEILKAAEIKIGNLRMLKRRLEQQLRGTDGSTNYAQGKQRQETADAYDTCVREIAVAERVAAVAKRYLPNFPRKSNGHGI